MVQQETLHVAIAPTSSERILGFKQYVIVRTFRAPVHFIYSKECGEVRHGVLQTGFDGPFSKGSIGHAILEDGFIIDRCALVALKTDDAKMKTASVIFRSPIGNIDRVKDDLKDFHRNTKKAALATRYGNVLSTARTDRPPLLNLVDFLSAENKSMTYQDTDTEALPFHEILKIWYGGNGYGVHFVGYCRHPAYFIDRLRNIAASFHHEFREGHIADIPVF